MQVYDWQHDCYEFNPRLPFEKDEFNQWLIPIYPNGDYYFFVTKDWKNVVFVDGLNPSIYLFGEKIISLFEQNKPIAFHDGNRLM
jgi:hypothetical protein